MNLYLVGQWKWTPHTIEIRGVFTSEEMADSVCDDELHFIMGLELDVDYGSEPDYTGPIWYPRVETKEEGTARSRKRSTK